MRSLPRFPSTCEILAGYSLTYIDEFVDQLLTEERVCDIILPRIPKRQILEENGELGPRKSRLLDAMEGRDSSDIEDRVSEGHSGSKSAGGGRSRGRSESRSPRQPLSDTGSRYLSPTPSRRSPSLPRSHASSGSRYRSRSRSISPDRMNIEQREDLLCV